MFGVLASGKTTLAKFLAKRLPLTYVAENLLEREHLHRWISGQSSDVASVQAEFYLAWQCDIRKARSAASAAGAEPDLILDHSLAGHHALYTRALRDARLLSSLESARLDALHERLSQESPEEVRWIYLIVSPDEILRRLERRPAQRDSAAHSRLVETYCRLASDWAAYHHQAIIECHEPQDFTVDDQGVVTLSSIWLTSLGRSLGVTNSFTSSSFTYVDRG
jgi:deoxyadenosine/deoxycytidine kinase